MTLACIDSDNFKDAFKDRIISPEEQLKTLKDKEKIKKQSQLHNKCDFYHQVGSYGEVRELLIKQFNSTDDVDEVLNEFNYKSSIAESGVFAVEHGFINNVISCITEIPLDELDKERFSGVLEDKFKAFINSHPINEIDEKTNKRISDYVSKLDIKDQDVIADIKKGMEIVWNLFKQYGNDGEKLSTFLNNHNLSKEIHSMMPPDFNELSDDNIIEIFVQGKSYAIFQYLKNNYERDNNLSDIEKECEELYEKLEEGIEKAKEYKRDKLDPIQEQLNMLGNNSYKNLSAQQQQQLSKEYSKLIEQCYECRKEHRRLTEEPKQALIKGFKVIQEEFKSKEKYPLHELREICNKFSVIDENNADRCLGDDLSRIGLVGFYFNDYRKSGFNNTILYNVLMKETTQDSLENKKQCVGRPGRKNGPIISSSYVDSSKISNLNEVKDKLMYSSPFGSFKEVKHKVDIKEYTDRVVKKVEEIINLQLSVNTTLNEDRYNGVVEHIIQHILDLHREIYNYSEYNENEAYKNFTKVLKSVNSALGKELKDKEIVKGGCEIQLKIKNLEFRISNLLQESQDLSCKIECKKEEKDKINDKLKIKVNFLKAIIIKLCTLVLRLWYFRLNYKESQVQDILKKDNAPTAKERLILKKAQVKVIGDEKALLKEQGEKKKEEESLDDEKVKLQKQYYNMHKFIGIIKRKDNVEQKDITDENKDKIIKNQHLNEIESELSKIQNSLCKPEYGKDLAIFKGLKSDISIMNLKAKIKPLIDGQRKVIEEYKNNLTKISESLMDLKDRVKKSDNLQDLSAKEVCYI